MVNKIGILIDHLDASDKLIYLGAKAAYSGVETDIVVFYMNISNLSMQIPIAFMEQSECFSFDGTVIATSIETAERLLTFPGPTKKLFYVWNMEWINNPQPYSRFVNVYNNPSIDLVARSSRDAAILTEIWKPPVDVVENFDFGW